MVAAGQLWTRHGADISISDQGGGGGQTFCVWLSRPIADDIHSGSFRQDAISRWCLHVVCELADDVPAGAGEVGIDLGLNVVAPLSPGEPYALAWLSSRNAVLRNIFRPVVTRLPATAVSLAVIRRVVRPFALSRSLSRMARSRRRDRCWAPARRLQR